MNYFRELNNEQARTWRKNNPEKSRALRNRYNKKLRAKLITIYGGQCVCCGESEPAFLCFDHVNDDGAAHRKTVQSGINLMLWIQKNNYPTSIQLLCYNCNNAKHIYKICPHTVQRKKEENALLQ